MRITSSTFDCITFEWGTSIYAPATNTFVICAGAKWKQTFGLRHTTDAIVKVQKCKKAKDSSQITTDILNYTHTHTHEHLCAHTHAGKLNQTNITLIPLHERCKQLDIACNICACGTSNVYVSQIKCHTWDSSGNKKHFSIYSILSVARWSMHEM